MKAEKSKDNTIVNYEDLIKSIDGDRISLKQLAFGDYKRRSYCIRHDVDNIIEPSMKLAWLEYQLGIRSTYLLLHTARYFDYSNSLRNNIKKLMGWGHHIGFHNDAITVYRQTKEPIKDIIIKPIDFIRSCGVEVIGTSAHGNASYYLNHYINYEIWKEFDMNKNEGLVKGVPEEKVSLSDFGLVYEAYFLDYDFYFSDSGGANNGVAISGQKPYENKLCYSPDNIGLDVVSKFNESNNGIFQLLIHANWWVIDA